jgi:hypothetical protein
MALATTAAHKQHHAIITSSNNIHVDFLEIHAAPTKTNNSNNMALWEKILGIVYGLA